MPEEKVKRTGGDADNASQEVHVRRGYSGEEQVGIVVTALVEEGNTDLVEWVKDVRSCRYVFRKKTDLLCNEQILSVVIRKRQAVIDATDGTELDDNGDEAAPPSSDAIQKFEDYSEFCHSCLSFFCPDCFECRYPLH
jgi:replication fork protection complex subunit Tof1/Swi1